VGAYSPPFKPLLEMDHEDILRRIHEARPDILLVAFGCPKQEKWINMHYRKAGVPFSVGVGATIDFLAGTFKRAPEWMQKPARNGFFGCCRNRAAGQTLRQGSGCFTFAFYAAMVAVCAQWKVSLPPDGPAVVEPGFAGVGDHQNAGAAGRAECTGVMRGEWQQAVENGTM
jgi:hypothetical protein